MRHEIRDHNHQATKGSLVSSPYADAHYAGPVEVHAEDEAPLERVVFHSYYAAKAARMAKERPTDWVILPDGRDSVRLIKIG